MPDSFSRESREPRRGGAPRRRAAIRWTALVLVLLGGSAAIYFNAADSAAGESADSSENAIRTPVRVTTPTFGTLERTFQVSGYVESDRIVTVTPKVQGTLEELSVDLGDRVDAGQIIARINDDTYRLDLRQAQANFEAAQSTWTRTEDLFESDATSRQNYDQARSQFQAAEAQLELARLQMDYTTVEAPTAGTVIQRHLAAGAVVGTSSALVTVADLNDLVVQAKIPEQHYLAFDTNPDQLDVRVELPSLRGRTVAGSIRTVSPYVSASSRNFDVVIDLKANGVSLRPGMFVEVTFVLERRTNAHSLPFRAFSDEGKLWYLQEDGTVAAAMFEPDFTTGDRFALPADWAERRVVIEGQDFLTEGQEVTVVEGRADS